LPQGEGKGLTIQARLSSTAMIGPVESWLFRLGSPVWLPPGAATVPPYTKLPSKR